MAVANSLAAVKAGARQVECTINGLGERAGNAALEEVVMAIQTRKDYFGVETRIDATQIVPASRLVSTITGYPVQPNKAVVGANAFAHESGIHQDGVLKHRETYEIMRAQDVGWHNNRLTLGKLSGRSAFRERLKELGIELESEVALNSAFKKFKELADKKSEIFDEDLHAIVSDDAVTPTVEQYHLVSLTAHVETGEPPYATLIITDQGREVKCEAYGAGPVDATFKAIETVVKSDSELLLYSVNNVTEGTDSQGEVTVRLSKGGRVVNGIGADTDIVIASAKAYLNALNKMTATFARLNPQVG
jgi:2-isopropylmalate synthase